MGRLSFDRGRQHPASSTVEALVGEIDNQVLSSGNLNTGHGSSVGHVERLGLPSFAHHGRIARARAPEPTLIDDEVGSTASSERRGQAFWGAVSFAGIGRGCQGISIGVLRR